MGPYPPISSDGQGLCALQSILPVGTLRWVRDPPLQRPRPRARSVSAQNPGCMATMPDARASLALARDVLRQLYRDRLLGEAAKIAYFWFLSLFPLILLLFSL